MSLRRIERQKPAPSSTRKIAIVGSPNVGKSALFNALTGAYVTVSNYPGTTVEVSRGKLRLKGEEFEIIDTPGMYSLSPITEEERVARTLLMKEKPEVILQVADAKNLARMLPFTLQLLQAGLPLILVVNIMDEAAKLGMKIDCERLEKELGIPVVPTISVTGEGLDLLRKRLTEHMLRPQSPLKIIHSPRSTLNSQLLTSNSQPPTHPLHQASDIIAGLLQGEYGLSKQAVAELLVSEDLEMLEAARGGEARFEEIEREMRRAKASVNFPPGYFFWLQRQEAANRLAEAASTPPTHPSGGAAQVLGDLMARPLTGLPILLIVLYVGLYLFVGRFGGGILVDFLQNRLFGRYVDPHVTRLVEGLIPWPVFQDLLVHDYGAITLGLKYAVAIILPIVGTFFLIFSIIEDTGYLPRLALLIDRFFKFIGLSGRAVIPLVLGFGCGTMATLVSRVLETRRERVIATLLLALAVPCSAQLGVILGLLSGAPLALAIWAGVVSGVFLLVGYLSSKILKGERASFYIEVPPLRWPRLRNILGKTYARMKWYFLEILPLFLLASLLIWIGRQIPVFGHSLFDWILRGLQPLVVSIGLPPETAMAFLFGFFRRDYGAAGLYDLHSKGLLGGVPLVVAMVTITLFIPCVAQWLIMYKERGPKTTLGICGFIFPFAWLTGFGLYHLLTFLGVRL
jgi:ferrous iron transport protein B